MTAPRADPSRFLTLGLQLAATMALCIGAGHLLDRTLGTEPWLLVGMAVFGVFCVLARLYRLAVELPGSG